MGKTTNILDLNNRLEKVEKENVAQNNYNSLKNRPKINSNLLTGDKTSAQLGLANAQDIGDISDLETVASDLVGAINEVVSGLTSVIAKLMFGGYSVYYRSTESSIDEIVDNAVTAPQSDDAGYFSAENKASIVGFGNRQFVFGWTNTEKTFAWIVVCSFNGISVGTRANASSFTFTSLTS